MLSEDVDIDVDCTDKNQTVEVNPYAAKATDDIDNAFEENEEEAFIPKPIAQADEHGNLQEMPMVRRRIMIL